jgi:3-keto-L-gulonate-6-phosphate decarboxylase
LIDPSRLAAANINPTTGLATDYLNHFNEAIMLLELMAVMPASFDDLLAWRPMSYREHFVAVNHKHRDLAIAAYESADTKARRRLDELSSAMNAMLVTAREALRVNLSDPVAGGLAQETAAQLKPLVARAGALINGRDVFGDARPTETTQATVDALMER